MTLHIMEGHSGRRGEARLLTDATGTICPKCLFSKPR